MQRFDMKMDRRHTTFIHTKRFITLLHVIQTVTCLFMILMCVYWPTYVSHMRGETYIVALVIVLLSQLTLRQHLSDPFMIGRLKDMGDVTLVLSILRVLRDIIPLFIADAPSVPLGIFVSTVMTSCLYLVVDFFVVIGCVPSVMRYARFISNIEKIARVIDNAEICRHAAAVA